MTHPFSGLHFGDPKVDPVSLVIDGHDVVLELGIEHDGMWLSYLAMTCDGEDVDLYYTDEATDVVCLACEYDDFDSQELAEVLSTALKRHLAGKAVQ